MSNEIISLLFENIQGLANESIDLEEFQESLEEFMEEFEYSLEDDDGMGTGTKVALGVGAAGAVGGAGYLTYKHLSKEKPVEKGIMHRVKRVGSAIADFGKNHWKKIAAVAGVGGAAYGASKLSGAAGTAVSGSKITYHVVQGNKHSAQALASTNHHDAAEHLSKAMQHTDALKKEAAKLYKNGKIDKNAYKGALAEHAAIKHNYHKVMAEMHSKHAREAETAEEAKKHADMAAHHAELAHSAAEEAEKFDSHGLKRFEGAAHKAGWWKEHLVNALHHFR